MFHYTAIALESLNQIDESVKGLKDKAIKEYNNALLMPRKKKKQAKKSALLLYSIACHGEKIFNL
jgi:hypothetical protein